MMRRRSMGDMADQAPISAKVRPQPRQSPVPGSMAQTLVQGVSIAAESSALMQCI
jgi:hypothetical protein